MTRQSLRRPYAGAHHPCRFALRLTIARALCCYRLAAPNDNADRTAMEFRGTALSPVAADRLPVLLLRLLALLPIGRCGVG